MYTVLPYCVRHIYILYMYRCTHVCTIIYVVHMYMMYYSGISLNLDTLGMKKVS